MQNTHEPNIVAIVCLSSSDFLSQNISAFFQLHYSDIWMPLSILGISLQVTSYYFYESVLEFCTRAPSSFDYEWNLYRRSMFSAQ